MVRVLVATAVREAVPQAARAPRLALHGEPAAGASDQAPAGTALDATAAAAAEQIALPAPELDPCVLLRLAVTRDRRLTAPKAPAEGLCFLEAGYSSL